MPTTDELQAQINALQQQLNQIIGMSNDDYVLTYSGEEVDALLAKAASAVRYDLAQSLTAAQQAQARENIAAMHGIESTDHPGCIYVVTSGVIEWVNPPLALGVEYRTTERYMGKPVYVKVVDCGYFAAAGTVKTIKTVDGNAEHMVGCTGRVREWQIPTTLFAASPADAGDVRLEGRVDGDGTFAIYLYSKAYDLTAWQAIVTIKYTKTTD